MNTEELIYNMAMEKIAYMTKEAGLPGLIDEVSPWVTAGVGTLTGAGIGALKERLLVPPEERNYLGSSILGAAGGFFGSMANRGFGTSSGKTLGAAGLQAMPTGALMSLMAPDQTEMKFQTQREMDELSGLLNDPNLDEDIKADIQSYMTAEKQRYGL